MKSKKLLIAPIVFFLLVNTSYYWEGKFGLFSMLTLLLLFFSFFILAILLIWQIGLAFSEKFKEKNRLLLAGVLAVVLTLTLYKPNGLIDFDSIEGENLLIAQYEGVANCTVTIKLKENFNFKERSVCFGINEGEGFYYLRNDTIFFKSSNNLRTTEGFYEYAILKKSDEYNNNQPFEMIAYRDYKDTLGTRFTVYKNNLIKTPKI